MFLQPGPIQEEDKAAEVSVCVLIRSVLADAN